MLYVNVAAGRFPEEEFINLDNSMFLRALPLYKRFKWIFPKKYYQNFEEHWIPITKNNKYKRHNCTKPLPFKSNSVDHILCSHFIEHVYPREAEKILNDFFDKLVPNGTLHIIVPDLKYLSKKYLDSNNPEAASEFMKEAMQFNFNKPSLFYRLLESTGNFGLEHRWMYDSENISKLLLASKFKIVEKIDNLPSKKYYETYAAEEGNLQIFAVKDL